MPIYEITTVGEEAKRLVKATSAAQAIHHCAKGKFSARTIHRVDEAAELFDQGIKMELAGVEPTVEPEQKPAELVRTGDMIDVEGEERQLKARIKGTVVQVKRGTGNTEADWADLREATPDELAADAERLTRTSREPK